MLPTMLRIAARNSNRGVPAAKIFELAYVYIPDEDPSLLPEERATLAGFSYDNAVGDSAGVFYHVRGIIEELAKVLGIRSLSFEPLTDNPSFHPGRTANVLINNKVCGMIGVIHPEVADNFEAPEKACFFELEANAFLKAAKLDRVYRQIPRFPGISRDIAVVVNKDVAVGDILRTCRSSGGKLLKEAEFFDVYEDSRLGEDKKSVAVSLIFRDDARTLTDDDIKTPYENIIEKLEKTYDAHLR